MRIRIKEAWRRESVLRSEHVARILREVLEREDDLDRDKEHVWALGLNGKHAIKYIDLVHLGTLTTCESHPREVFRRAVACGAAAIILAHNHPTGDTTPGRDDFDLTERMVKAGRILGIRVLDHVVVVGAEGHSSLADMGIL